MSDEGAETASASAAAAAAASALKMLLADGSTALDSTSLAGPKTVDAPSDRRAHATAGPQDDDRADDSDDEASTSAGPVTADVPSDANAGPKEDDSDSDSDDEALRSAGPAANAPSDASAGPKVDDSDDDASESAGSDSDPVDDGASDGTSDGESSSSSKDDSSGNDSDEDSDEESDHDRGSSSAPNNTSDDNGDEVGATDAGNNLSEYERLRLQRIERNRARLAQLGLVDLTKAPARQRKKKKEKTTDGAAEAKRSQPRRSVKSSLTHQQLHGIDLRRVLTSKSRLKSGKKRRPGRPKKDDYIPNTCAKCKDDTGDLVSCSYCIKQYHSKCHVPEIPSPPPDGPFRCADCEKDNKTRRRACGVCDACTREEDCGTCVYCLDKPAFGGGAKLRRKCIMKKCVTLFNNPKAPATPTSAKKNESEDAAATTMTEDSDARKKPDGGVQLDFDAEKKTGPVQRGAGYWGEDDDDDVCFVCHDGGVLICCDDCTRVYHSACHSPIIYNVHAPLQCQECKKAAREERRKRKREEEEERRKKRRLERLKASSLVAVVDDKLLRVKVTGPTPQCVVCNISRDVHKPIPRPEPRPVLDAIVEDQEVSVRVKWPLDWSAGSTDRDNRGPLLDATVSGDQDVKCKVAWPRDPQTESEVGDEMVVCRTCDDWYHHHCHKPRVLSREEGGPRGNWKCANCKQKYKESRRKPKHLLAMVDGREWKCKVIGPRGNSTERTGKNRCGECEACKRENCGQCRFCLDMRMFGGPRKIRLPCEHRRCAVFGIPVKKTARKTRCWKCEACTREECGKCRYCLDKPKFGGTHKLRQPCELKRCTNPKLSGPPSFRNPLERKIRCGECEACTMDDCGKCRNCLDKPKFGGLHKLKQSCDLKQCTNPKIQAIVRSSSSLPTNGKNDNETKDSKSRDASEEDAETSSGPGCSEKKSTEMPEKRRGKKSTKEPETRHGKKSTKEPKTRQGKKSAEEPEKRRRDESTGTEGKRQSKKPKPTPTPKKKEQKDPVINKIKRIIKVASEQHEDHKTQDLACEYLRKIITTRENAAKVVKLGGLQTISKAMKGHPDKALVQAEAFATIAEIAWIGPENGEKIASEGCIDLMIGAMERLGTHPKVQQMGCGAFRSLSYDPRNCKYIKDRGVIAVLSSMKRNPRKVDVVKEGCLFLQNMIFARPETVRTMLKAKRGESEVAIIPILVEAMTNNPGNPRLQESICGVLANVALSENGKFVIAEAGAIPPIIAILKNSKELDSKQTACSALKNLAMDDNLNRASITEAGGTAAALAAMRSFPSDCVILTAACGLLKELASYDKGSAQQITREGGVKLLVTAMDDHADFVQLQVAACALLSQLQHDDSKTTVAAARRVVMGMENYPDVFYLQFEACHALSSLVLAPKVIPVLKSREVRELLSEASSGYPDDCKAVVDELLEKIKSRSSRSSRRSRY